MGGTRKRERPSLSRFARMYAILIPSALSVVIVSIWLPLELRVFAEQRQRYRDNYVQTRREMVRLVVGQIVESVTSRLARKDDDSLGNLRSDMVTWITRLRFPQNGYAWIMKTDLSMVAHPFFPPSRQPGWYRPGGMADYRDSEGVFVVRRMTEICTTAGSGFLEYLWEVPGQHRVARKLSYVEIIPALGWIVGAGVYLEDIDVAVIADERSIQRSVLVQTIATGIMLLAALLLSGVVFHLFARKTAGALRIFQSFFTTAALARRPIDESRIPYAELCTMARLANHMIAEQAASDRRLESSEAQLRQTQKMEAIGRLAGGVAHDFNNILTAILGYSEILLENRNLDVPAVESAREIRSAAHRACGLTRQLLSFARRQPAEASVLDLNGLVSDMSDMLRRVLGETIVLRMRLDPSLGMMLGNPGQLEQVILNLAVNSRDAMPQGGEISIETSAWRPGCTDGADGQEGRGGPCVRLSITDTGCGMDETVKKRLFEPFFTTKEAEKGTGLGLSIVYGIVTQAGGSIAVESSPGRGTVVRVTFPQCLVGSGCASR